MKHRTGLEGTKKICIACGYNRKDREYYAIYKNGWACECCAKKEEENERVQGRR